MSVRLNEVGDRRKTASDTNLAEKAIGDRSTIPGAMEAGVKVKMPAGLLGHVTRAQATLEGLRKTGGVEGVVRQAFKKYENELRRLQEACHAVHPVDDVQRAAKEAWIERNVSSKEKYLEAMKGVFEEENPRLQLNDTDVLDKESMRSARSGPSSVVSVASSTRREAAAKTKVLEMEREHRRKQRQLEEQERKLRQQREDDELELKLQQAKIMEEAIGSDHGSRRAESVHGGPMNEVEELIERALPPVSTWAPRTTGPAPAMPGPMAWAPPHRGHEFNAAEGLLQQILLPQSKLPIFKGDPLDFMWFLRAFEMRVEAVTSNPARRLYLLLQHLEGDPKTLVMGCQLAEDPADGYSRAKHALIDKYGNRIRQALAFKAKLLAWPALKKDSIQDLEKFSIQLQLCREVKLAGSLAELDAGGTLVQLMNKLPQRMQEGWQMRAHKIENNQHREANFEDFSRFVGDVAAARTHPVYGKVDAKSEVKKTVKALATATSDPGQGAIEDHQRPPCQQSSQEEVSCAIETKELDAFVAPCLLCDGNHATEKCRKSMSMTLKERRRKLGTLCFACLRSGHPARQCPKKATCLKCKGDHPTVLHLEKTQQTSESAASTKQQSGTATSTESATSCATASTSRVAVAVVPVKVWCQASSMPYIVKAVLDPGSTATFATTSLVRKLGLKCKDSSLQLTTMTTNKKEVVTQVVAGMKVAGLEQSEVVVLPPVYTVSQMPYNKDDVAKEDDVRRWDHLEDIPFRWQPEAEVELLIGMNTPEALRPLEVVSGGSKEPYAVRTLLGWCLNGPIGRRVTEKGTAVVNLIRADEVKRFIERLHYTDFEGAFDFQTTGPSQEDQDWLRIVASSIVKVNDRYQIALPFRERPPPLMNNEAQALNRLETLRRKFQKNETFKQDYVAFMGKMEASGFVELVDTALSPSADNGNPISYVPHHGVYHPHKPEKIRVVFNCSSKFQGCSLNDCLIPGPDLTSSLLGVLMRFRQEKVAFIADVESMFYQVQVPPCDRDALRYLWWPGGRMEQQPRVYRMKVHLFGAASSPSCANYALRRAADDAWKAGKIQSDVCQSVKRNFYVDDCLKSMPTTTEAIRMATGLVRACQEGGFRLTKFVATSMDLLQALPKTEWAKDLQNAKVDFCTDKHDPLGALQERALGVLWDVTADAFKIRSCVLKGKAGHAITKRGMLSALSSVYDPLGMAGPVIIVARVLFRNLTKDQEVGWDDGLEVRPEIEQKWTAWIRSLQDLHTVTIPRCYRSQVSNRDDPWELHVFCDASEEAYAAVAYLRQWQGQEAQVIFVMGKTRVTPPKVVTIPRLELTAAKLATEIATLVQAELQYTITRRVFWTDSQTVLKYLKNKVRRFHTFVANRVSSILTSSTIEEWNHVPTAHNPADEGSRGLQAEALAKSAWLKGPEFLQQAPEQWPRTEGQDVVKEDDPEVRVLATTATDAAQSCFVENLAQRYSSFFRLKKAVRVWRSFIAHVSRPSGTSGTTQNTNACRDIRKAEEAAVRGVQRIQWAEEVQLLKESKGLPRKSALFKLSPALSEEGIIVMRSRTRSQLPIIPGQTRLAKLVVQEAHIGQGHGGRQSTAAQVLRKHWITGLNALVRRVLKECPACQRRWSIPKTPEMAVLPEYRVQSQGEWAFETTGVDYFGPFLITKPTGRRAKSTIKMYGVIFTCAVMRAVHLEVAEDLSSSAFINALRRFMARRGHVKKLVSDNGTNFVGAEKIMTQELRKEMSRQRQGNAIKQWLEQREVEWIFNPPGASHHGGFWERLIRSVRRVLTAVIPEQRPLTYDGLNTVLCEVEAILNNRPLTPVSNDPDDHEALTPNHLLLGREGPTAPPGDFRRTAVPLKRQWRKVQHLATLFWRRWMKEYQVLLHQRAKWHQDGGRNFELNDVVLVLDHLKPREYWPLGKVTELHRSKDGKVRVVTVRTLSGMLKRPVTKLCLLEATSDSHKSHL